jgi:hypothetical protein
MQQKKTPHRFEKAVTKIGEIDAVRFSCVFSFLFFAAVVKQRKKENKKLFLLLFVGKHQTLLRI